MSELSQETIEEFVKVTGAPEERAKFYLECSGNDIQIALSNFLDFGHIPQPKMETPAAGCSQGAEVVESSMSAGVQPRVKAFMCSGYKFGHDESKATEIVAGASPLTCKLAQKQTCQRVLKLWEDGFSIDDGNLRDYQDPINRKFMEAVMHGEVPDELIANRGQKVNLTIEDNRDFFALKNVVKALSDAKITRNNQTLPTSANHPAISVDSDQPTTSIQLRLVDGSRLVAKFNHTHLISDIRRHIVRERPQYEQSSFVLMTTFPSKELEDENMTIKESNLLSAVLVQKLK